MTKGVFREGDLIYVSYDGRKPVPLAAQHYANRGYEPPISDLPPREQWERRGTGRIFLERTSLRTGNGGSTNRLT